jgi:hypothetical protein
MQDKKKKNIKVRDLKPKKDAKGGSAGSSKNLTGAGSGVSGAGSGVTKPGN